MKANAFDVKSQKKNELFSSHNSEFQHKQRNIDLVCFLLWFDAILLAFGDHRDREKSVEYADLLQNVIDAAFGIFLLSRSCGKKKRKLVLFPPPSPSQHAPTTFLLGQWSCIKCVLFKINCYGDWTIFCNISKLCTYYSTKHHKYDTLTMSIF